MSALWAALFHCQADAALAAQCRQIHRAVVGYGNAIGPLGRRCWFPAVRQAEPQQGLPGGMWRERQVGQDFPVAQP